MWLATYIFSDISNFRPIFNPLLLSQKYVHNRRAPLLASVYIHIPPGSNPIVCFYDIVRAREGGKDTSGAGV